MNNKKYVTSDLHGCYEKYMALLERLQLSEQDTLYILGDIVDRGHGSIKILQDLMTRKNVVVLRGNHDQQAMIFLKNFAFPTVNNVPEEAKYLFYEWLRYDGGYETYHEFLSLTENEKRKVLSFINTTAIFDEVDAGGNHFFLAHTVPEKEKFDNFDSCTVNDFMEGKPEYEKIYAPDTYIVTGHTPTGLIHKESEGRIWKGNRHIVMDCGAVFGHPLGCMCLDTMEEIYIEDADEIRDLSGFS